MSNAIHGENSSGRSLAGTAVFDPQRIVVRKKLGLGHINLRGDSTDASFTRGVRTVLRFDLPSIPNTVSEGGDVVAYWLAPTEWLLVLPAEHERAVAVGLRDTLAGQFVSVVELSGGQVVLLVTGGRVRDVLAKGCPLDLHEGAFALGQCAQSHLAKAPVLLRPVASGIELILPRSFADYLWQWLESAVQEYGGWVVQPTSPDTVFLQRAGVDGRE